MHSPALSDAARDRLVKLCGLLGSDHVGERAAAGLLASSMLMQHGLTWGDIITPPTRKSRPSSGSTTAPSGWRADHEFCCNRLDQLNQRECNFVLSLRMRRSGVSEKQATWLHDIADRLKRGVG